MPRTAIRAWAMILLVVLGAFGNARAETRTIARCGKGFLEEVDGYRVLHVKGTPYEMGYPAGGPAPGRHPRARPVPVRREGEGG